MHLHCGRWTQTEYLELLFSATFGVGRPEGMEVVPSQSSCYTLTPPTPYEFVRVSSLLISEIAGSRLLRRPNEGG